MAVLSSSFVRQLQVLGKKNLLLALRNWKGTLGQILAPIFIVALLFAMQGISNYVLSQDNPHPTPSPIQMYPKCIPHNNIPCTSIIYAPNNVKWVNTLMESVSRASRLEYGVDVVGMGHPASMNYNPLQALIHDNDTLNTYIVNNPNTTQNAILFTTAYVPSGVLPTMGGGLPLDVGYMLLYNATATSPYHMELMRLLDETVLLLQSNKTVSADAADSSTPHIHASYAMFPVPHLRVAGFDIVAAYGGVFFYLPPMITFFIILTELVMEKETHLRLGMRTMGLNNAVYWIVWWITGSIFNFISTLVLIAAGASFQFSFFLNSNIFSIFLVFFLFGLSMLALAFVLSAVVNTSKTAQTLGYAIILVGFVFQVILCSGNGFLVDVLYAEDIEGWVVFVRGLLTCYPPFNLAMVFSNIAMKASDVISVAGGQILSGPGFFWKDMFVSRDMYALNMHMVIPSPVVTLVCILADMMLFLVLTWYLDNVLPGPHGAPRPVLFFLTREYWGIKDNSQRKANKYRSLEDQGVHIANRVAHDSQVDGDVRDEARHAVELSERNKNAGQQQHEPERGIYIVGLTKIYPAKGIIRRIRSLLAYVANLIKLRRGGGSSNDYASLSPSSPSSSSSTMIPMMTSTDEDNVADEIDDGSGSVLKTPSKNLNNKKPSSGGNGDLLAVDGVSLALEEGQIFCILGHNGAGKTTTINMLTGLFAPTSGHARVYGKSILHEMDDIRKSMGVCPQHDILWNELTAREHLRLFAKLKGVDSVEEEVEARLEYMGLSKVGDHKVGSFSGGMKRRLSVAIAAIGDPKVIFLDEPTTGMDPVNRAGVWHLIQNMKQNRLIILTSHSMEEADILSDKLCIMSYGKVCAIGNSLHLKKKFGNGYRIHVATRPDYVATLHAELSAVLPDIVMGHVNAGSVTWHVGVHARDIMPAALQVLERQDPSVVREWGVACSSLEEVFLDVTKSTGFQYDSIEGEGEEISSPPLPSLQHHAVGGSQKSNTTIQDTDDDDDDEIITLDVSPPPTPVEAPHDATKQPSTNVFRALLLKNFTLQKRQTGTNFCQVLTPLLVMAILVILQAVIRSRLGPDIDISILVPGVPLPINVQIPNVDIPYFNTSKYIPDIPTPPNFTPPTPATTTRNTNLQEGNFQFSDFLTFLSQFGSADDDNNNDHNSRFDPAQYVHAKLQEAYLHDLNRLARVMSPEVWDFTSDTTTTESIGSSSIPPWPAPFPPFIPCDTNLTFPISSLPIPLPLPFPIPANLTFSCVHGMVQPWPPFPWPIPSNFTVPNITYTGDGSCLEFFYFSDNTSPQSAGYLDNQGKGEKLLGNIQQRQTTCAFRNHSHVQVPFFQPSSSFSSSQDRVMSVFNYFNTQNMRTLDQPPNMYLLADGIVDFTDIDYTMGHLAYTFSVNENRIVRYHRKNNFTRVSLSFINLASNSFSLVVPHGQMGMMDLVHQAFASSVLKQPLTYLSTKFCQTMPFYAQANILALLEAFGTVLFPVALSLQLPVYIYILAMEKSEKLKEMMKQHGMKTSSYIITNYLFDMLLYTLVVVFFWVGGALAHLRFFTQTNWVVLILLLFGWGNALISLAFLLSTFISSKRTAIIAGYVTALVGTMIGIVFAVGIYGDIPYVSIAPRMPTAYLIWPQFAFVRGIYLLNSACALKFQCYGPLSSLPGNDEMIPVLVALYLSAIVYFCIYLYLDQVIPTEFGVPKHPLFIFEEPIRWIRRVLPSRTFQGQSYLPLTVNEDISSSSSSSSSSDGVDPSISSEVVQGRGPEPGENEDVQEERNRVYNGLFPKDSPLVTLDLRKEYPPSSSRQSSTKVAVHNLTMAVSSGQCFGLLGENGAGKTTTISILTGLLRPTRGTARIAGYDILRQMDHAHLVMGVCPQFNILWDRLTVREHMLFYARLKGVPSAHEASHVDHMLRELGLTHAANRASSDLSGGMKRRLSIGIALVGFSRIVFLDEPTTGLDPASRRQLWSIINRAKKGRAIVLTTHSMEEAELLTDTIGIMAHGQLRALGTQQHLKTTLGAGYLVRVSFKPADEAIVTQNVLSMFPGSIVSRSYRGWAVFEVNKENRVSDIFARMARDSDASGIVDWSCDQVGLEDVFQRVVAQSKIDTERASTTTTNEE